MEIIPSLKILEYFYNAIDQSKAEKLHYFCAARAVCFLYEDVKGHGKHFCCYCFKCRICRLLMYVMLCRKHHHYLKIITNDTPVVVKNNNLFKVV